MPLLGPKTETPIAGPGPERGPTGLARGRTTETGLWIALLTSMKMTIFMADKIRGIHEATHMTPKNLITTEKRTTFIPKMTLPTTGRGELVSMTRSWSMILMGEIHTTVIIIKRR